MIKVVVTIGHDVQVILTTDLPYHPDPAADCCTRAVVAALRVYDELPTPDPADVTEQP